MTRKDFLLFLKKYPYLKKYFVCRFFDHRDNKYSIFRRKGEYIVSFFDDCKGPFEEFKTDCESDAYGYLYKKFCQFYLKEQ